MFPFPRKKRDRKPPEAWMKWLMLGFVVYALVVNNFGDKSKKIIPENIVNTEALENKILPQDVRKLSWEEVRSGGGAGAICGQKVTLNNNISFTIGDASHADIEPAIFAMKKGAKRVLTTPSDEKIEVELLDISPALPDFSGFQIIGDTAEGADGYKCGDTAKLGVRIFDVNGKNIYTQNIAFTIGKSEVPLAIEQGAMGMKSGEKRVLIVAPALQKPLGRAKTTIDMPLPKKQAVIIEVITD